MMPAPAYIDLSTLMSGNAGLQPETVEERILTCLSIMASGQNPDGSANTSIGGGGGLVTVQNVNSTSALAITGNTFVLADSTSGTITLTLPLASTCIGAMVWVRRATNNGNNVIVVPSGADTIDGATQRQLLYNSSTGRYNGDQYLTMCVLSIGTGWADIWNYIHVCGIVGPYNQQVSVAGQGSSPGIMQMWNGAAGYMAVGINGSAASNAMQQIGTLQTVSGTTAGTIKWTQPQQGTEWKMLVGNVSGYQNNTVTAQTITFVTPFNVAPVIVSTGGLTGVTATTTTVTLPVSMGSPVSGALILQGV